MKKNNTSYITNAAATAALYVAFTYISSILGLSSGVVQLRISEALCVLPVFTPAAIPGLTVGCFLANLLTGCLPWDIVFGTLATLIGAIGTRLLRKKKFLSFLPPIVSNTIIIPIVLMKVYAVETAYPIIVLCVFAGEAVSIAVFGGVLYALCAKHKIF